MAATRTAVVEATSWVRAVEGSVRLAGHRATRRRRRDLTAALGWAGAIGLLALAVPLASGVVFGETSVSLDVEAVRRQMGVVLQDGQLLPGTVGDNICGVASLSISEQWELAELVALADDIRAMPMGLDTPVTLNGGAFPGGQRQRLCIARSLAARPRILVAHRLSTMAGADRIVVLEGGRVVEQGTYGELMATPGPFFALADGT